MSEKNIFEINRAAWNEALAYHQKARKGSLQIGFENPNFTTFNRDCDDILIDQLKNFDFVGKTISQIPCNNGRELLSLMRFGAKEATGFDISDTAILEAKQLAEIAKLNANFVRTNILEIGKEYDGYFDFIYISEGSLQWFPNLSDFFSIVSRLLKPDGSMLIFEIHPFAYFFEIANDLHKEPTLDEFISYFEKGPYSFKNGMDYIGQTTYDAKECCWYMHKMSDIINAIIFNGLEIEKMEEFNMEMVNNESIKHIEKFPLSYMLTGKKKT